LVLVFEGQAELYYCDNDLNFMSWAVKCSILCYKYMNANLVCENVVRDGLLTVFLCFRKLGTSVGLCSRIFRPTATSLIS